MRGRCTRVCQKTACHVFEVITPGLLFNLQLLQSFNDNDINMWICLRRKLKLVNINDSKSSS